MKAVNSTPAALVALAALTLLPACGWPRYTNLPDDSDTIPAADDPRSQVTVTWKQVSEADLAPDGADNSDPREVVVESVSSMNGVAIDGVLRGIGWNADFEAPPLEGEGCQTRTRNPGEAGDWAGDVDFAVIEVADPDMVLCAEAVFPQADLGWDLLVYPLDAANCDLPQDPLLDPAGEVLGLGRGGAVDGWKIPVNQGQRYGVLLAGYSAPEAVAEYRYKLGLSLVPGDGAGTELCPRVMGDF